MTYYINIKWDEDAGVWCALCDDIPLALESNSFDALLEKTKIVAYEILVLNNKTTTEVKLCFKYLSNLDYLREIV